MIIDLHNHTSDYSLCSNIDTDKLLSIYIDAGIDGICITEHNFIRTKYEQQKIIEKYSDKIQIFFGLEASTNIGHVLIFGLKEYNFKPNINIKTLIANIDRNNTALIWAHPFRWQLPSGIKIDKNLLNLFDGVELYNGNLSEKIILKTQKILEPYNPRYTGGSDTHTVNMALKYGTKFINNFTTTQELVNNLKKSTYKPIIL